MNRRSKTLLTIALLWAGTSIAEEHRGETEHSDTDDGETIEIAIDVVATEVEVQPGRATYSKETIKHLPTGNANLADVLAINPTVDFSRTSDRSANSAVLRPPEISIHGQPFYQNLFIVDGADVSNDLNPADAEDVWSTPSLVAPVGGSSPQGYYLDIESVESIEVFDSNIPAEYGGFTGGVISVESAEPEDGEGFSVQYGTSRSSWESFHVNVDEDLTRADTYRAGYTPEYTKTNLRLSGHASTGALRNSFTYSQRHSTFEQHYENDADVMVMLDYEDLVRSLTLKSEFQLGLYDADASFRYADRTHDGLTSTTYTGMFEKNHSAHGASLNLERAIDEDRLYLKFSYDRMVDSLQSDSSYFSYHEYLEGSGQSRFEGAFGNKDEEQTSFSFDLQLDMAPRPIGNVEHDLEIGGALQFKNMFYERPDDILFEQFYCIRDMGREGCQDQDGDGASSAGDEFLNRQSYYYAGKVDLDYSAISFYVQDQFEVNRWTFNVGLRADRNGFLEDLTFGPRMSLVYQALGDTDQSTDGGSDSGNATADVASGSLVAGLNRYYGRNFFRTQLNDAIYGWRESYINLTRPRGRAGEEVPCSNRLFTDCTHLTYANRSGAADVLTTPYSDEIMVGWVQNVAGFRTRIQYVRREGKDLISRERDEDGLYFYTNNGQSSTDSVSLNISNPTEFTLGGTTTEVHVGFGYRNNTSNRQSDSGYDEAISMDLVYYEGELITLEDLPPFDYNIPVTVSMLSTTNIPALNMTWSNTYKIRRGGVVARDTREDYTSPETGIEYDVYADMEFDGLFTVDSQIEFQFGGTEDNHDYFVRLQIHNLFDKVVDYSRFTTRASQSSGRRAWLDIGANF